MRVSNIYYSNKRGERAPVGAGATEMHNVRRKREGKRETESGMGTDTAMKPEKTVTNALCNDKDLN